MKAFIFFLLSGFIFSQAQSQDSVVPRDTGLVVLKQAEVDTLFSKVLGSWTVKARAWSVKSNHYKDLAGTAFFDKKLNGQYIHETFSLDWFGTLLSGEGYLKYAPLQQRFDLVQLDDFSSSPLKLIGTWDAAKKILSFRPVFNHAQWDEKIPLKLRWDYFIYADGSFKKEIWEPAKNGEYMLTSDYHYFKKSN